MTHPQNPTDAAVGWPSARRVFGWAAAGWTLMVAVALGLGLRDAREERVRGAEVRAREAATAELSLHSLNAARGGVYALVSESIAPDPALAQLPQRDLATVSGEKLTRLSPVHLERLVAGPEPSGGGPRGHLRSLTPRRPENAPDPWETGALQRLAQGERLVVEETVRDGRPALRYMVGVPAQAQCGSCHSTAGQGLGSPLGGFSVVIPLGTAGPGAFPLVGAAATGLVACWLVGLLMLRRLMIALRQRWIEGEQSNRKVQDSEQRFRTLAEQAPVGIFETDAEGRCTFVNRRWCELAGLTPGAALASGWSESLHPEDREAVVAEWNACLLEGREWRRDFRCASPEGRIRWVHGSAVALRDGQGRVTGALGFNVDTTERREGETQLREQAALLDIAQDAICVQSLAGRIEFWNRAAEELYGWSKEEALGAQGEDLLFGRVSGELLQARNDVLTLGSWSGELQHSARDGRIIEADCRLSLVRDAQGEPKSILIVSTDLTEKKRLEKQFLRSQRMECIGALSSGLAHDLNNVFSPILMVAEFLATRPSNPGDAELLELLRSSADRGSGIVRQLLTFGRGQESERVELRLELVLKEMGRLAQETFPKNIQFIAQSAPDLWPVVGDITQIHQVLLNLCVNARDAMPEGGALTLGARNFLADGSFCELRGEARPGPYVVLEVSDQGTGIPASIRDKIFDPFFTTKPPGEGTGLGLSTVLGIVKAHYGFVEVSSEPGEGSSFRVFLPAIQKSGGEPRPVAADAVPVGNGETVLVVDDEGPIRTAAQKILSCNGYLALVAVDGVDALTQFTRHQSEIRVVLTDMMMPSMDGAAFIRAVRKVDPRIPIVAMSGLPAQQHDAELAGQLSIPCLAKPFAGDTWLKPWMGVWHPAAVGEGT